MAAPTPPPALPTPRSSGIHFYLNIVVTNKDDVVEAKVKEKVGKGFFGFGQKAAVKLAQHKVTDESIASKVSASMVDKIPAVVAEMGIDITLTQRFLSGALCVLACELKEVDPVRLIEKAQGEEASTHMANMLAAFKGLGIESGTATVQEKCLEKAKAALMEKLTVVIPEKLLAQGGIACEVCSLEAADEPEFMFEYLGSRT